MNKSFKRLLSFLATFIMLISSSFPVFAIENSAIEDKNLVEVSFTKVSDDNIVDKGTDSTTFPVVMLLNRTSSTTESKTSFTIGLFSGASLSGQAYVSSPCTLYSYIYDSTGTHAIGAATMTFTSSGTYNFTVSPTYVSYGSYYYGHFFSVSGVSYDLYLYATQ